MIMALTFLNLTGVSGILVGLVEGISIAVRSQYSSDVIIKPAVGRDAIEESSRIISLLRTTPEVESFSARYIATGKIEASYDEDTRRADEAPDEVTATIVGIDPEQENELSGLRGLLIEGEYLNREDTDGVMMGGDLLSQYQMGPNTESRTLNGVQLGSRVRLTVGQKTVELRVRGIVDSKVDDVALRVYLPDRQLRSLLGITEPNRGEIAIKAAAQISPLQLQAALLDRGAGVRGNRVQTWDESQGTFFKDISATFGALGNMVGSIGILIACITVFIVVFINALNRRKYIGILKAIGISPLAIELSYVFQSLAYAVAGISLGLAILYGLLVPFFLANPINFPFSDGILVAPVASTLQRAGMLAVVTLLAGYVPARLIVSQPTMNAILGR
jgi:putative ABC transport system permease protein